MEQASGCSNSALMENKSSAFLTAFANRTNEFDEVDGLHEMRKEKLCVENVTDYCIPLLRTEFAGQSSAEKNDTVDEGFILNLGLYLSLLDKIIRKYKNVSEFTINDDEYLLMLRLVAGKRQLEKETADECFERLWKDSKIFQEIYHKRGALSKVLHTKKFWGTRQQLLCGKVIGDWVDTSRPPLDPIFGALLCPCGGRVGSGDSYVVHNMLYDGNGYFAYHAAVHDAFGYLISKHSVGPGYNYLYGRSLLNKRSPLSGQYDGIEFWKRYCGEHALIQRAVEGSLQAFQMVVDLDTEKKHIC